MQKTTRVQSYLHENNVNTKSSQSSMNNPSYGKGVFDATPYFSCIARQACRSESSSAATFYCLQCANLQCTSCEQSLHQDPLKENHIRVDVDLMSGEGCSVDSSHPAILYCSKCVRPFCYPCFQSEHQQANKRDHRPEKYTQEQQMYPTKPQPSDQRRMESKPIKIASSYNEKNKTRTPVQKPSSSSFETVRVDDNDDFFSSPSARDEYSKTKSRSKQNRHDSPKQHNFDQNMLLESMLDEGNEENDAPNNFNHRSSLKYATVPDSNGVFLLLDANEHLTVNNDAEFCRQLHSSLPDPSVKCVSIIGNTGDGKSYTLNQLFFDGQEKFRTSATSDSCTMGVWAALDDNNRILVLDTEGRLGLSQNDNVRNRLLLKILCISDIIIFRTRAPKLPNDMFQFLSDASNAFLKYFKRELESVMKACQADGPVSAMGPTLIVFHETQHTDVLKDTLEGHKTAVEQLKERFEKMHLTYDAYSSIEYVGTQTSGGKLTNFDALRAAVSDNLRNNKIRSPRRLSVIFRALKALNEKFNHTIPPDMPSTLPDDFFSCFVKCLSCGMKCHETANHQKDNIPHQCEKRCSYNKELDNEVWKCLACHREGRDIIVYGKLITKNDGLVQGLLKYVWSGFVIECPYHGEIYRSRKYWYGNNDPKDVTRVEVVHVWPGDKNERLASDVTPRKFIEMLVYAGSYLSAPTKMLTEMVADQVAPSYWTPNKDVHRCTGCDLTFGSSYSKHHCRACGQVFCDTCTTYRQIVSWVDPDNPVRVCKQCYNHPKSTPPSSSTTTSSIHTSTLSDKERSKARSTTTNNTISNSDSTSTISSRELLNEGRFKPTDSFDLECSAADSTSVEIPKTRRVYETVVNGLEKMGVNYPIELIKESTRPNYWRPDNECHACYLCKMSFNSTTNRLHHCRNCGDCVCESCSPNKRPVPERDWLTPVRVCNRCDDALNESNKERK